MPPANAVYTPRLSVGVGKFHFNAKGARVAGRPSLTQVVAVLILEQLQQRKIGLLHSVQFASTRCARQTVRGLCANESLQSDC